jgi:hypothetical protein
MELLYLPLTAMSLVFITAPIAAFVPAAIFLGLYRKTQRFTALLAGLLWLAYLPYEYAMKWRILCSGECNIRVGLLLIYPVLLVTSLVALIVIVRSSGSNQDGSG